jgi:hypothetical protein
MMKFTTLCCGLAALLLPVGSALAGSAPSQLYNKTINVGMSINLPGRAGDGTTVTKTRNIDRVIYVSSKGRIFLRVSRQAGRLSQEKELGPGVTSSRFQFSGNRMIGTLKFISGAGRMTITFNPSFTGCTVDVIVGHEAGKAIVHKGLNGKTYTATGPATVSQRTCSVRAGNPFAS